MLSRKLHSSLITLVNFGTDLSIVILLIPSINKSGI